ncbi:MAG TPA: rRNA maturation RNase YbeY [Methyloceanibacter sp.]|jgi:probable rRNA maturation factor|nr:rRNA maturation RNase YbeY [Methyloceanibacter sp.]
MADGGPSRRHSGASLAIEIVRRAPGFARAKVTDALLRRAARAAFRARSPSGRSFSVTLVLIEDEEMRDLNRLWRGKDAPTNVLSFPADAGRDRGFLGDIVVAYETAHSEAKERGISFVAHVSHLVVHGMLHLLGFDHADDADALRMERVERVALASIGVADPYADADEFRLAEALP